MAVRAQWSLAKQGGTRRNCSRIFCAPRQGKATHQDNQEIPTEIDRLIRSVTSAQVTLPFGAHNSVTTAPPSAHALAHAHTGAFEHEQRTATFASRYDRR